MIHLTFLGLITLLFHWQPQKPQSIPTYPAWFWEMPADSHAVFAVGYARRYSRIDTSYAHARRNSIWQLVRAMEVTIEASQELYNRFGQNRLIGLQEVVSIDSSLGANILANFCIIDSAVVGDMVVSLAKSPGNSDHNFIEAQIQPSLQRPNWIDTYPRDSSAIHAVGTAPLFYYEHHSWERAEANARLQLAYTIASQIQSVNLQDKASMETWSEAKASIKLRNAAIIKRWLDWQNRQCFVLCRMPL